MPSTIPEFELREIHRYGPQSWLMGWWLWHFWGVIFQKNIDVNEVKPHEELFVFVRCQVIRSILKDVMFFVHLDISGSYPRHGGWSLFPCPDALEDGEGCIFFSMFMWCCSRQFRSCRIHDDPWIGFSGRICCLNPIFHLHLHGNIHGFRLRCSLGAPNPWMDGAMMVIQLAPWETCFQLTGQSSQRCLLV